MEIGTKNSYQSPEYLNTTKMNTKKVWIWGLTPRR